MTSHRPSPPAAAAAGSAEHAHAAREMPWLRASLVAVWLGTAVASTLTAHDRGPALLQAGGVHDPRLVALALWGGVALDAVLGAWMWWRPGRLAYTLAFAATLLMTALATALVPGLWLDPLGALLKNLPILAALWVLRGQASHRPVAPVLPR